MKNISIEEFDIEIEYESEVRAFLQKINAKSEKLMQKNKTDMKTNFHIEEENIEEFNLKNETIEFFVNNITKYLTEWIKPETILSLLFYHFIIHFIKNAHKNIKSELTFDKLYIIFNSAVDQLKRNGSEIVNNVESNIEISSKTFDKILIGLNKSDINPNWVNISYWQSFLENLKFKKNLRKVILFAEYLQFHEKEIS